MAVINKWNRYVTCCDTNSCLIVLNRTRCGEYREELKFLPDEIRTGISSGELKLCEDLCRKSNKIVLRGPLPQ